jgi:hypothetical protein
MQTYCLEDVDERLEDAIRHLGEQHTLVPNIDPLTPR